MVRLMHMLLGSLVKWWYGLGWMRLAQNVSSLMNGALSFFSVRMLLGSLFAPYRQISAGRVNGPIGVQLRVWGDRLFSRFVGALVRLALISVGLLSALICGIFGLIIIVAWPLLPIAPAIGLFLMSGIIDS